MVWNLFMYEKFNNFGKYWDWNRNFVARIVPIDLSLLNTKRAELTSLHSCSDTWLFHDKLFYLLLVLYWKYLTALPKYFINCSGLRGIEISVWLFYTNLITCQAAQHLLGALSILFSNAVKYFTKVIILLTLKKTLLPAVRLNNSTKWLYYGEFSYYDQGTFIFQFLSWIKQLD